MIADSVLVEQLTVVHVEDEWVYEEFLASRFRRGIGYLRVGRLSEAGPLVSDPNVAGFIIDLRLPFEQPSAFEAWGSYPRSSPGLIEKIRMERPELPVLVLTNFFEDQDLQDLVRRGVIDKKNIFQKLSLEDDVETLVDRLHPSGDSSEPALLSSEVDVPTDMAPRLQWLVLKGRSGFVPRATTSTRQGEVAVLARVDSVEAWETAPGVRAGTSVPLPGGEWIVTGRVMLDRVEALHRCSFVKSLQAAERLRPTLKVALDDTSVTQLAALQVGGGGSGVVIGIVDQGCDFAHLNFRKEDGTTRLLALWDQAGGPGGTLYESAQIDAALAAGDPYKALGYELDPRFKGHGTHVMDIAAGGGRGTGTPGVAPQADLVFVDLSVEDEKLFRLGEEIIERSFGDTAQLVEAVQYIFEAAGERPCVVNLSLGTHGGPHDGSTLVEQTIDSLVTRADNRAVAIAAGNCYGEGIHAGGSIRQGETQELSWEVPSGAESPLEIEVWYSGRDRFAVEVLFPDGSGSGWVEPGERWSDEDEAEPSVVLAHLEQHPDNGDNVIGLFLETNAPTGVWRLRLHGIQVADSTFHAWIERDDQHQVSFLPPRDETHTLGSISCGRNSIVVGAYDAYDKSCPCWTYSSAGPTRDGREKPELCAPGYEIEAAKEGSGDGAVRKSGTSMAAPLITGVIALMLAEAQACGIPLGIDRILKLLLSATRRPESGAWDNRYGWGRIDARAAVLSVREL